MNVPVTTMPIAELHVRAADLSLPEDRTATLRLLDAYAADPMGDGRSLSAAARRDVIPGLRAHPTTVVFLAWLDGAAVGLAICFRGFSTFAARPLLNISDYYVPPAWRGTGVGRRLLESVERWARDAGCCRLTLEVQENNHRARSVYTAAGFRPVVYVAEAGNSLYLCKSL